MAVIAVSLSGGCATDLMVGATDGSPDLTTCSWPAGFEITDAFVSITGPCYAARTLLQCTGPNGEGVTCISNDPTQCLGFAGYTCRNQCAPNEYAAYCGSAGESSMLTPPRGCTPMFLTPAGTASYCCPCGG